MATGTPAGPVQQSRRGIILQQQNFLQGRLYDRQTGEGVPFAMVQIEGNAIGIVSNEDGSFLISSLFRELGEYLRISSLGYESFKVAGVPGEYHFAGFQLKNPGFAAGVCSYNVCNN